jgi:hypothetical protein
VTFEKALGEAIEARSQLMRSSQSVVWSIDYWTPDRPELSPRILWRGLSCKAPVHLTAEDLTATDWELVHPV